LGQRRFVGYLLNASCATMAMYIFLSAAPELLLERRQVPVELFGWFTFSWAGMFVVASLISGRVGPRLGGERMVLLGVVLLTTGGIAMVAGGLAGATSLAAIVLPLMLMGFGNGFTMPASLAGAMGAVPAAIGGAASAAIGIAQTGSGAVVSWIAGHIAYPDQTPFGLGIVMTGAVSLIVFVLLSRTAAASKKT
jgi:MFS transporter, DHA1 family, multidrug resistance protein